MRAWKSSAPPWWNAQDNGLVPWSDRGDALFRDQSEGPAGGLGCEVTLENYSERPLIMTSPVSTRADISVLAWLGTDRGPYFLRAEGPDNQNDMRMAFPLTGLLKGDPIVFDIRDRDAVGFSWIDHVEGKLDGPPPFRFVGKRKIATVSCRSIARGAFERAMAPAETKANETIAALGSRKPNPALADLDWRFGNPWNDARDRLSEVAAFGGWDDPRVAPIVASLEKAEADHLEAYRKFVIDERARLGAETTIEEGLVVKARRVRDTPPEIEMDVRNPTERVQVLGSPFHQIEGFGVDGMRSQLYPDESTYDLKVPAGASVTLHYRAAVGAGLESPRAPMILRAHRREVSIPVGRPFVSPISGAKIVTRLECPKRCAIALTSESEGVPIAEARRGLRIEGIVRGRRSGFGSAGGQIILDERNVAAEDAAVVFSPEDARGEVPWSVATDR